jgi:hypothetical protein
MPLYVVWIFSTHSIYGFCQVQERALKTVPGLCETIDFAEVQSVLFPRVAVGFGLHGDSYMLITSCTVGLWQNTFSQRQGCDA